MKKFLILLVISSIAMGQVSLQVSAPATLDQINVADLDISKLKDLPLLFSVTITTNDTMTLKLNFQVLAEVGGESENIFADVWSLPFEVNKILSFTNQDLALGRAGIKNDKSRTQIYEDKIKKIKEIAQLTGRLPAGSYRFVLEICDQTNKVLASWEKVYEVTNPSRIDLISPSYQAEVRTQFPIFKWIAPYLKEFEIYVYEKLPNQTTPEEVVSGDKNLRWKFKTKDNQVQYPREALPLEDGKTYFWFVKSSIAGSRGTEEIRSEIWSFNVKLGQQVTVQVKPNLTPEQKETLNKLIDIFKGSGNTEIVSLLSQIVSDFVILVNGKPVSPSELPEILESIRQQLTELGVDIEVK